MSIEGCLGALIRLLIIGPFLAFLDLARGARFRPHPLTASFADDLVDAHVLGPDEEMGLQVAGTVCYIGRFGLRAKFLRVPLCTFV